MEHQLHPQGNTLRPFGRPGVHEGFGTGGREPEVLLAGKNHLSLRARMCVCVYACVTQSSEYPLRGGLHKERLTFHGGAGQRGRARPRRRNAREGREKEEEREGEREGGKEEGRKETTRARLKKSRGSLGRRRSRPRPETGFNPTWRALKRNPRSH